MHAHLTPPPTWLDERTRRDAERAAELAAARDDARQVAMRLDPPHEQGMHP